MTMTGQCLCGQFRYEVEGEPQMTAVCHCKNCQRQAGSSYSILIAVPESAVSSKGELKTYVDTADSGNKVNRHFCETCGSPVFTTVPGQEGVTFIKAGTLDDTSILNPTVEFWTKSAQDWVALDESRMLLEGNPGA